MKKYLAETKILASRFKEFQISQVPRTQNKEADALSKLASMLFCHLSKKVLAEVLPMRSIDEEAQEEVFDTEEDENYWMVPIRQYLEEGNLPAEEAKARKIRMNAGKYTIIAGSLYRKGYSTPWDRKSVV